MVNKKNLFFSVFICTIIIPSLSVCIFSNKNTETGVITEVQTAYTKIIKYPEIHSHEVIFTQYWEYLWNIDIGKWWEYGIDEDDTNYWNLCVYSLMPTDQIGLMTYLEFDFEINKSDISKLELDLEIGFSTVNHVFNAITIYDWGDARWEYYKYNIVENQIHDFNEELHLNYTSDEGKVRIATGITSSYIYHGGTTFTHARVLQIISQSSITITID